jgi:cell division protein FtsI/penicillin-binding protein 2
MIRDWAIRGFHVLILFAIVFGIEGARLAWLQMGIGSSQTASTTLSKKALLQRSDAITLDNGRGQFRDRQGRLLTGVSVRSLTAFPDDGMQRGTDARIQSLAVALGTKPEQLSTWLGGLREPDVWKKPGSDRALDLTDEQAEAVKRANLIGVAVLPYRNRYPDDVDPIHAIGFVSQDPSRLSKIYGKQLTDHRMDVTDTLGGLGLELSMDRLIQGIASTTVMQVTDAARRPLEGLGLRMTASSNPHYPLQVTTTLDLDAQRAVDQVLSNYGIKKGAAVVLNASNADILSMVSLPKLDPYNIGDKGTDERNHALLGAPPGSVFKTVTLAAAIESGVTSRDEVFHCNGHYGKYGLKCWKEGGHGDLTLEQAYAQSCNVVFAELAERMDPAWLQITGDRLGLARQVGWQTPQFVDGKPLRLLEEEDQGSIFLHKETAQDGGVRTGTGIGQRDVRVTPLQAANMVVTILHDGKAFAPRLVKEIRYADGDLMTPIAIQHSASEYGRIQPRTAALLREGMESVVRKGTASNALRGAAWPLAGKSGTAELAGAQKARNDQWFVGYGPAKGKAHYAVAVLIEDQPAGLRNRAAAVFGDIMDELRLLELRSWKTAEPAAVR